MGYISNLIDKNSKNQIPRFSENPGILGEIAQPQTAKKVLLHLHTPPVPTDGGDKRRLLGMLRYFRDRREFFSVDVVVQNKSGNAPWDSISQQEVLQFADQVFVYDGAKNPWDFVYARSQSFYYQTLRRQQLPIDSDYFTPPGYVQFMRSLLAQQAYDYVWINYLEYAHLATRSRSIARWIIDIHDIACQGRLARKNVYPLKGRSFDYDANFVREVALLNQFDAVLVNSHQEMDILQAKLPLQKLHFVPHVVENTAHSSTLPPYSQRSFDYDLLFVGTGLGPNVEGMTFFLERIFPEIVRQQPNIRLAIAGTVSKVIAIDSSIAANVVCLGFVPDLAAVYLKSKIVICPLLSGAGTKVKLQEAMAYAVPIVTTSIGASGMRLIDGSNAFITDDANLFANRVLQLCNTPELAQTFSQEIHATFQQHYSNSAVYSALDHLFHLPLPDTQ